MKNREDEEKWHKSWVRRKESDISEKIQGED